MSTEILALERIPDGAAEHWGGKATNLGKLIRLGANVPPGFCISAEALDCTVAAAQIKHEIEDAASTFNYDDFADVENKARHIRNLIEIAQMPSDLEQSIRTHYAALVSQANRFVAVRSSVAVRGTSIASFPGMMDTYHYVLGEAEVLDKVRECWASLWSSRAIHIRHHRKIPHAQAIIAPVVQLMVNADSAGVLFTANPITKDLRECIIEANWGIGESVVSGRSMTDSFILDKRTGKVKQRAIAAKTMMVVMDDDRGHGRKEVPVPSDRANLPTLSDAQLAELCAIGRLIEDHFAFPADIEWAYQGGKLYLLQARKIRNLETS
jgi:phosphoenolpyruvate synthase/pyruvate phosphate dikinase